MFEMTKETDSFDELQYTGRIPRDATYDFTFEHRFLICHYPAVHTLIYVAYDFTTGYGSEICRNKTALKSTEYHALIKRILGSIKYTGDSRYLNRFRTEPTKVIDSIFRVILPTYGYAVREEQIKLSKAMYRGLTEKSAAICEAEVGTGKTMAYLVAAFVAKKNNMYAEKPVTITTSSIELQKSIVEHEIPNLSRMLMDYGLIDSPLTSVLRKGKEHYFCKARYDDFLETIRPLPEKYGSIVESFDRCDFGNKAFDLDRVRLSSFTKGKICVKGNCSRCKLKDECRYARYRKAAVSTDEFDFQVTNHNMFLTEMKINGMDGRMLLRASDYVIVDEAHKLHEVAQTVFGEQLTESAVTKYLTAVKLLCGVNTDTKDYHELLNRAYTLNKSLFDTLKRMAKETHTDEEGIHLISVDNTLIGILANLLDTVRQIEHSRRKTPEHEGVSGNNLISTLKVLKRQNNINDWIDIDENGKYTLCCVSKNIGALMNEKLWDRCRSYVLTSGTLNDGSGFGYFKRENGIDMIPSHLLLETHTDSPFDYENHTRLYLPGGIPSPTESDTEEYINAVAENIFNIIEATNGHTAILFTSYRTLSAVHEKLKERLSKYDVICMSRGYKTAIADFKASKNGILFASGSMWEGVNVVGDKLSSVIIVRLPFPMASSFSEMKREDCADIREFIRCYAIPEMVIKLLQGIGRLIRTETDTGLVSILDSRTTERYMKTVKSVVGRYPRVETLAEIREFFKAVKPDSYFDS